jgi:hypothetical protein
MTDFHAPTSLTRRSALAAMGAGLAALSLWPAAVQAAGREVPSFSFVVVSDTHLGREDRDAAAEQWSRTAAEIEAAPGDFVLHLGDIVDGAREAQYPVYKDIRKTIRKPVHEIPGNHDTHALFAKHVREAVDWAFDHRGVRFLLLNNSRRDSVDGFVTADQLQWLGEQCAAAAAKGLFLVLAMHVPAHDNAAPDAGCHVRPAHGQKELYALVTRHRDRVLATFHGHFHCGLRGWDDHAPLHEVVFPSALFNLDRRLTEQQAPGYCLPEFRPGFALVRFGAEGLTLKYKPVGVAETRDKVCPLGPFRS